MEEEKEDIIIQLTNAQDEIEEMNSMLDNRDRTIEEMETKLDHKRARIEYLQDIIKKAIDDGDVLENIYDCSFCTRPMELTGDTRTCRNCGRDRSACDPCIDKWHKQCNQCKHDRIRENQRILDRMFKYRHAKRAAIQVGMCFKRMGDAFRDLSSMMAQSTWATRNDKAWIRT
jgi:hypothetical protein